MVAILYKYVSAFLSFISCFCIHMFPNRQTNRFSRFVQFGADQDCHCGAPGCRKKLGAKPVKLKASSPDYLDSKEDDVPFQQKVCRLVSMSIECALTLTTVKCFFPLSHHDAPLQKFASILHFYFQWLNQCCMKKKYFVKISFKETVFSHVF